MNLDFQNPMRAALENRVGNVIILNTIDSTHHLARRLIEQVDADDVPLRPAVIVAGSQTGGCGRASRRWQSPVGGLYLSWVSGEIDPATVPLLPMLAASAAQRSLAAVGANSTRIKWPNDLLIGGRKVAGLITHARHGERVLATVGLGVNIDVTPPLDNDAIIEATSIAEILGAGSFSERAASIAGAYLDGLSAALTDPDSALQHWRNHLVHEVGGSIEVRLSGGRTVVGRFAGVTEQGHMRIEGPDEEMTLTGGDVIETDPGKS